MKILKLLKLYLLVSILFVSQFNLAFKINADTLSDPQDIFEVTQPGANNKVSGVVEIKWRSYDDDSTFVPYTISLLDSTTCKNTITNLNSSNGLSSLTSQNSFSFNSLQIQSDNNLDDGKYCLKVCAAYKNTESNYSACNSRNINIVNKNRLPTIQSTPNLAAIKDNTYWKYEIEATDTDDDDLSFYYVYGPSFLVMDNASGILSTIDDDYQAVLTGSSSASYRVVVGVDDGISGTTTQEFQLRFIASSVVVPGEEEENSTSIINILAPIENEEIAGLYNIQWEITDEEGVESIVIHLVDATGKTLSTIYESALNTSNTSANFNTLSIPNGEYYVKFTVEDSEGIEVSKLSKKFSILNLEEEPNNNEPIIVNLSPGDRSEISDARPKISGEFASVPESQINPQSLLVKLDDVDITSLCIANELSFECNLSEDLNTGEHKINIRISDTDDNLGLSETTFNIVTVLDTPVSYSNDINFFGFKISREIFLLIVLLCCVLLILLFVPWVLIRIWRRRTITTQTTVTEVDHSKSFDDFMNSQSLVLPNQNSTYLENPQDQNIDINFYNPTEPEIQEVEQVRPEITQVEVQPTPVEVKIEPVAQPEIKETNVTNNYQNTFEAPKTQPLEVKQETKVEPVATAVPESQIQTLDSEITPPQDKSPYVEPTIIDDRVDLSEMDSAKLKSNDNLPSSPNNS